MASPAAGRAAFGTVLGLATAPAMGIARAKGNMGLQEDITKINQAGGVPDSLQNFGARQQGDYGSTILSQQRNPINTGQRTLLGQ